MCICGIPTVSPKHPYIPPATLSVLVVTMHVEERLMELCLMMKKESDVKRSDALIQDVYDTIKAISEKASAHVK